MILFGLVIFGILQQVECSPLSNVNCKDAQCKDVFALPLLDSLKATLKADVDVSPMNKYLETYTQQLVTRNVEAAMKGLLTDMVDNSTKKILEMIENKFKEADELSKERFSRKMEEFDSKFERKVVAKECSDICSDKDGVYTIYPEGLNKPVEVYCVMGNAKKWTVIHKRSNTTVDFNRNWQEYKDGFGSAYGEYWLGNDNIHAISSNGLHEISIYMISQDKNKDGYANYSTFLVGDEQSGYLLTISGYHGNTNDAMQDSNFNLNGQKFTTKDRDNDNYGYNCAVEYPGGWWFNSCHAAHLNGDVNKHGRKWYSWDSKIGYSLMMIRKTK